MSNILRYNCPEFNLLVTCYRSSCLSIMPTCHRIKNIIFCLLNRFFISYFLRLGQTHCYRFLNILPTGNWQVVTWRNTMNTHSIDKCFNTYFCERFYRLFCELFFSLLNQHDCLIFISFNFLLVSGTQRI